MTTVKVSDAEVAYNSEPWPAEVNAMIAGIRGPCAPVEVADMIARAFDCGRRTHSAPRASRIVSSSDVRNRMRARMECLDVEHFVALSLDARHRVVKEHWIAKGTMTSCAVSIADIFRALVSVPAPNVIFVHNHPSGDPAPSGDDIALTARLVKAGELIGIRVLDHIIIGREGYSSLDEAGVMGGAR